MMRILYLVIALNLWACFTVQSQLFKRDPHADLKDKIDRNFDLLSKSNVYVGEVFSIEEGGISVVYQDNIEYFLDFDDVDKFLTICREYDMYQLRDHYVNNNHSNTIQEENIPVGKSIRISLDPGHFGSTKEESVLEDRYVKYRFDSASEDTFINEASLNYEIAEALKKKLSRADVEVMLSRKDNESAVGMSFDQWIESGKYVKDLRYLVDNDEFAYGKAAMLVDEMDREELFEAYTFLDFKNRAIRINEFNPDFTLVIHLNASEDHARDEKGYSSLTEDNYSMAFVPGSFMLGELDKVDQRIDFLRLLVSDRIEQSIKLSESLIESIDNNLGVPPHNQSEVYSEMIQYNTVSTMKEGIYARNLYMTRSIKSPLSYLEVLVQNNEEELKALADPNEDRIELIADALYKGVAKYLFENDVKSNK